MKEKNNESEHSDIENKQDVKNTEESLIDKKPAQNQSASSSGGDSFSKFKILNIMIMLWNQT